MDQIKDLLKNIKFVIDFNAEDLEFIATNSKVLHIDKGKLFMEMGKYSPELFIICKGQVKISIDSKLNLDDNSTLLAFLNPGNIVGVDFHGNDLPGDFPVSRIERLACVIKLFVIIAIQGVLERKEASFLFYLLCNTRENTGIWSGTEY